MTTPEGLTGQTTKNTKAALRVRSRSFFFLVQQRSNVIKPGSQLRNEVIADPLLTVSEVAELIKESRKQSLVNLESLDDNVGGVLVN